MSGLEDAIAAAPIDVSSQLNYQLPPLHHAVKSRAETTWFASGSGAFGPGQVKQMRFNLSDSGAFLDPGSVALRFKINNVDAANLMTMLGPALFLSGSRGGEM